MNRTSLKRRAVAVLATLALAVGAFAGPALAAGSVHAQVHGTPAATAHAEGNHKMSVCRDGGGAIFWQWNWTGKYARIFTGTPRMGKVYKFWPTGRPWNAHYHTIYCG